MGDKTFLLSDAIHINKRNFKSLFDFCAARNIDFVSPEHKILPIDAFGDYSAYRNTINIHSNKFRIICPDDLFEYSYEGISVFNICISELLSFLVCKPGRLRDKSLPNNPRELFNLIYETEYDRLIDNMSAVCMWVDIWKQTLKSIPQLAYVGIFSGSLIYARVLLELMRYQTGRCFVLESFFTGTHFYCEERYTPISNHSDVKLKTVYRSIVKPYDRQDHEVKRNHIRHIIKNINNKNVTQPEAKGARLFNNDQPTLLILGQVINDFSLLESNQCGINSLESYKQIIYKILTETQWNIIFKAHPWERKKHNLRDAITLNELTLEFGKETRVALVEDHALYELFEESNGVICLNSQSGIEAALAGFKPIQLGDAFWGRNGFSHDINLDNMGAVLKILDDPMKCYADLNSFEQLELWLISIIDGWLIPEENCFKAEERLKKIFYEISGRSIATNISRNDKFLKKNTASIGYENSIRSQSFLMNTKRKLRKLINHPADFFKDSKNKFVRRVGLFFFK
jgi:hypothetical protein